MELATSQYDEQLIDAYTIKKDFRTAFDPKEGFEYVELPSI